MVAVQPSHAEEVQFWGIFTGGIASYAGGATPFSETTAPTRVGAAVNPLGPPGTPAFDCFPCNVSLQTGNLNASDSHNYYFDGGGSITVTGGIGFPPIIPMGTALVTGAFTSAAVFVPNPGSLVSPGQYTIFTGEFLGTMNPSLLALFGLPDVLYLGSVETEFFGVAGGASAFPDQPTPPDPFSSGFATDLAVITLTPAPVPEPYSFALLATVFAIFGVVFQSRLRRRV
jgi:hypothetical protein